MSALDFLNVQDAADYLGVSKSCAYAAIDAGEFPVPVVKVGKRIKVPARALYALAGDERAAQASTSPDSASCGGSTGRGDLSGEAA